MKVINAEGLSAVVNGVRLAYSVSGHGEVPLVLVHGSWGSRHNWDAVVPSLSERFHVVAYDRRGHSESSCPPGQGSFAEDVADVAALIEHLDLAQVWVAGNSSGAAITVQLAAARPDLLAGVIVHEPPFMRLLPAGSAEATALAAIETGPIAEVQRRLEAGDDAGAAEFFVNNVALGPGAWPTLPEAMRTIMIWNGPTYLDELHDPSWRTVDERALAKFDGPALLTAGSTSPAMFALIGDRLAELLPRATRLTYPSAGHIPHVTHPEEYVATLVDFVSRHERVQGSR
jgi:pimeloyl-ACP methyl ester carboxylesterase